MTPITPNGTRRRLKRIPFSRTRLSSSAPTGSFKLITLRTSLAIAQIRSSLSNKRSINASDIPLAIAASVSCLFAARIAFLFASNSSAIIANAVFFTDVAVVANSNAACCAACPIISRFTIIPYLNLNSMPDEVSI